MNKLSVVVNDQLTLQYDRDKPLSEQHQHYLGKLDAKFDKGIELQGEVIANPDIEQRAKFMALSLMEGILYDEDSKAAVSLAWLASRLPDLKQVKAIVDEDGTRFDLIFDSEYEAQQVVHFDGVKF